MKGDGIIVYDKAFKEPPTRASAQALRENLLLKLGLALEKAYDDWFEGLSDEEVLSCVDGAAYFLEKPTRPEGTLCPRCLEFTCTCPYKRVPGIIRYVYGKGPVFEALEEHGAQDLRDEVGGAIDDIVLGIINRTKLKEVNNDDTAGA